jgi:hypothetical protein
MRAKPIDPEIKEAKISLYAVKKIDGECALFSRKDQFDPAVPERFCRRNDGGFANARVLPAPESKPRKPYFASR